MGGVIVEKWPLHWYTCSWLRLSVALVRECRTGRRFDHGKGLG
jgi:hypothetical protein